MTDTTQGADAPDDGALFKQVTEADTLDKFENPPVPPEPPKAPDAPAGYKKPEPPKPDDNAPVPPGRLREEAEARRRAERERDDLRAQLAAFARVAPPQQQAPPAAKPDIFENPQGYVRGEIREEMLPVLEQIRAEIQSQREAQSLNYAIDRHGDEVVSSARQAMEQGMSRGDPNAWATYNRAMQSHDPYGVIVRWHREGETLRTIGGDLEAYKKRVLEEALSDPEYRKRAIEAAKGQAPNVHRPASAVAPPVTSSPSLGNVGAGGGDQPMIELSDTELFRAATTAKRR